MLGCPKLFAMMHTKHTHTLLGDVNTKQRNQRSERTNEKEEGKKIEIVKEKQKP